MTNDVRGKAFSNLGFLETLAYRAHGSNCTRFVRCVPTLRICEIRICREPPEIRMREIALPENFEAYRRVDSRSTTLGEIRIFLGRTERFSKIRSMRSSAARAPIWHVP